MEDENEIAERQDWLARNAGRFLLCARRWTRSQADAEDVFQEAFVRYWKHQRNLPGDPSALIITSIRRAALDLSRRNARRVARDQAAYLDGETVSEFEPADDAETKILQRAVAELPADQREVVTLKIWGELTFKQIAEQLDCPQNTVASRYRYALAKLKETLTANAITSP